MDSPPVHIAVLTLADDAANADRAPSRAISDRAKSAGHQVVDEEIVKDNESAIRDQLVRWIAEPNIDVVIILASLESASASAALAPLVMQTLPGFTDLFRWLTFQEIGASAMQSTAEAAQCESTYVFVLPGHQAAVAAAMDKLILPQLDVRTMPKNLVTQMPRLKDAAKRFLADAKSQPVAASPVKPVTLTPATQTDVVTAPYEMLPPADPATAPVEAIPTAISSEKTTGGSGLPPKLPARPNTTTNTIARKQDDPPTKQIDLASLEKQIAMSSAGEQTKEVLALTANDAKTKVVDMSAHQAKTRVVDPRRLPRLPPGADEQLTDDDIESLSFTSPPSGAASPVRTSAPIGVVKSTPFATPIARSTPPTGRQAVSTPVSTPVVPPVRPTPVGTPGPMKPPGGVKPAEPPTSARQTLTPPVSTPVVPRQGATTPVSTPVVPRQGATTPLSTPVTRPTEPPPSPRQAAITPVVPPVVAQRPATEPPPLPKRSATEPPPVPLGKPPTGPAPVVTKPSSPEPVSEPVAAAGPVAAAESVVADEPPRRPTPQPNAAELWARATAPSTADVNASDSTPALAAAKAGSTNASASASTDDAAGPISTLFANQPARKRPPTPPPAHLDSLAKQIAGGELPQGDFVYPIKRGGMPLLLKILLALALLGAGFFAFVKFYPLTGEPQQTAAVTPSEPTPPAAVQPPPPPVEPAVEAGSDNTDIEIETAAPSPGTASPTKPTTKPVTKPSGESKHDGAVTKPTSDPGTKPSDSTATTESKPDPGAAGDDCDEVSCVLSKYDRPCCERYRPTEGFTPKNTVPEELDKAMVKAGIEKVKPRIVACGEKGGIKGTVKVAVTVDAEGTVKTASATESPDQALGSCVAGAMKNAKFAKTINGGEFTYPFVF